MRSFRCAAITTACHQASRESMRARERERERERESERERERERESARARERVLSFSVLEGDHKCSRRRQCFI
jgi:hypothetical protein